MNKKLATLVLSGALLCSLGAPALAAESTPPAPPAVLWDSKGDPDRGGWRSHRSVHELPPVGGIRNEPLRPNLLD